MTGLPTGGLGRLHDVLGGYVNRGEMPGLVAAVSRGGETHVEAIGTQGFDGARPMGRDTIFRIASLTKPVTAVAVLSLVEECRLRLDDSVEPLLPELADRRVLTRIDGPLDDTVPARRPITLRDLLTFRFGFGQFVASIDDYPILRAASDLDIGMGPQGPSISADEWMRRLGSLPLMHQPGEKWLYNTGSDVLSVLGERATGQSWAQVLRERVFDPLGMADTGHRVPAAKIDRLARAYTSGPDGRPVEDADRDWTTEPAFPAGADGLVSTVDDYLVFARMLLNQGTYDGTRVLSRPAVRLMTTDQLTDHQRATAGMILDGAGWGFGLSITVARTDVGAIPGRYGWDGGSGTSWRTVPDEDLIMVLLTQRSLDSPVAFDLFRDFWTVAAQLVD